MYKSVILNVVVKIILQHDITDQTTILRYTTSVISADGAKNEPKDNKELQTESVDYECSGQHFTTHALQQFIVVKKSNAGEFM